MPVHFFRRAGFVAAHLVGEPFVIAHGKPLFLFVGGTCFQDGVQPLDKWFRQPCFCQIDDEVYAAEVVDCLHDVVYVYRLVGDANRVGLKDVARLFVGQAAAFHVVGVVGEVDLCAVVDAAFQRHGFFLAQRFEQGRRRCLPGIPLLGGSGVFGDVPCLSREKRSVDFPRCAVVARRAFRDAVLFCELYDRDVSHGFVFAVFAKVVIFADNGIKRGGIVGGLCLVLFPAKGADYGCPGGDMQRLGRTYGGA